MESICLEDHFSQVTLVNETKQRTNRKSESNSEEVSHTPSEKHCRNNRKLNIIHQRERQTLHKIADL